MSLVVRNEDDLLVSTLQFRKYIVINQCLLHRSESGNTISEPEIILKFRSQ